MENENKKKDQWEQRSRRGKLLGGLLLIGIGVLLLGRAMGLLIPDWVLSWPMLLIAIGVVVAIKHRFQGFGWLVMIAIGSAFLVERIMPDATLRPYLWPALIIGVGLWVMFGPRRRCGDRDWTKEGAYKGWTREGAYAPSDRVHDSGEEYLDNTAVFGGIKKNIISKNFRGGEINCIFGGAELDLTQADIQGKAELEINCILGGAKLIVPANWEIKSEMVAVMGGIEDKRPFAKDHSPDETKVLVIRGTVVLGGIDIRSY